MNPGQIPDRPPRKREQPKWPKFLLIAGITVTVAGFVLTFGPLAPDLGGTDAPSIDEPASDRPAGDTSDDTDTNGDETTGTEEGDTTENDGLRGMIGEILPGDDASERADTDGMRERCVTE